MPSGNLLPIRDLQATGISGLQRVCISARGFRKCGPKLPAIPSRAP
jgi:hypothetical protein